MTSTGRAGRPKASSRETLAEAACELFLERGYDATSVADITQRAGVSRSSFFNYFASKSDVLWSGVDERIGAATGSLEQLGRAATGESVRDILLLVVRDFAPDPLALALRNAAAMGLEEELVRDTGLRLARLSAAVSLAAAASGVDVIRADILGAAHAAAVLSSLRVWAEQGAGRGSPETVLLEALGTIHDLPWS
ncbi:MULTISPECIES: TetR/AcrR family transcriptional regulator [unclassified Microbacterium]|uniref:TetR/AcrR family transcriptional regulator n=1 Tax=unclassified Microbacterium TaxID=2609290 RepID=UPI000CFB7F8E|nr:MULTISPECIES: TetR/AcrR family transcriptional regulator [unclassified Microbacterium]PQZ61169.1 TetR family transcriptional regulator [Microbacterium sp. MYb43]PQZ82380.1 TetR family transcriptional regulator [Microbacterium sp. MYb40]PRB23921.1 TetR family transcriptional regulator [Microbacterium sp. MYb54]PRB30752.1 TetR family transcriptional regulator [Microbacterium sp. MYb50]PRB70827.1 TetR family transcriptional regulator [Microbacterium sp. MYb24]